MVKSVREKRSSELNRLGHRGGGAELAWWQNVLEMVPVGEREQRSG